MSEILNQAVRATFDFLRKDFHFNGPIEWNIAYELEHTYVKGKLYFNIAYDGAWMFSVGKTKNYSPELNEGRINPGQISYKERRLYDLYDLFSNKQLQEIRSLENPDQALVIVAEFVKTNPDVLDEDLHLFSIFSTFFRKFSRLLHLN